MTDFIIRLLKEFVNIVGEMAPYLIFGFIVAGILSVMISQQTVERHIGRPGVTSVFKAALFGVPLPLCSCGVIPVSMSLRRHGAGRGATTAFLISTPQTGVDSILVTYSLLGPMFAVARPIVALLSGMLGGLVVNAVVKEKENEPAPVSTHAPVCVDKKCGFPPNAPDEGKIRRAFKYGFITLPEDIGRYVIFGLLLAGAISALVPENYFTSYLGRGIVPMLAMMAVGIPMYVCSTASVPVAAAIMAAGVSPGAALVFLMTGPATNAATITAIWKVLGRATALIYVGTIAASSLIAGFVIDALYAGAASHLHHHQHWMMPVWIKGASGILLIIILIPSLFKKRGANANQETVWTRNLMEMNIHGMRCNQCVANITRALNELDGVETVNIELATGRGVVTGAALDSETLASAVRGLGYTVDDQPAAAAAASPDNHVLS